MKFFKKIISQAFEFFKRRNFGVAETKNINKNSNDSKKINFLNFNN